MSSGLRAIAVWSLVLLAVELRPAVAADAFYDVVIADLDLGDQQIPQHDGDGRARLLGQPWPPLEPYAVLNGAGEIYMSRLGREIYATRAVIRSAAAGDVRGRLFVPAADMKALEPISFTVPRSAAKAEAEKTFYETKLAYLAALADRQIPGGAWFRHQIATTRQEMGRLQAVPLEPGADRFRSQRVESIGDAFDFLTGGRAMSENLQLDRLLRTAAATKDDVDSVAVADLKGITIAEVDWSKLNQGLDPKLDVLAAAIPADQHAVFFPTFNDFVRVIDEGLASGTPLLAMAEPRAEDARTLERYQRQLCLSLSGFGRLVGPKVVRSVAITGSDPFYRTGTDLAILFATADPAKLEALVLAQILQGATGKPGSDGSAAKPIDRVAGKFKYRGLRSADRTVCVYVAQLPQAVVVTNSPYQLERLSSVAQGESPAAASLGEFKFFRDRYRLGDAEETAFLFISDATIRRWCGPQWRIAASRRTRDLAVMNELQATYLDEVVNGQTSPDPLETDFALASGGELRLMPTGVTSSVPGSLELQTPIAEIPLKRVTKIEAEAYDRWREGYERNWRWAFDPIGLRIGLQESQTAADLTVMPLIAGSQYQQILAVTQGAKIHPAGVDAHDALAQVSLALNLKSPPVQQAAGMVQMFAPGSRIDLLSWMGGSISVYLDDDPFWAKVSDLASEDVEHFLDTNWYRAPLAVQFEVANPLKLTAFLVALRAFIDQTSANMLLWESLQYRDQNYVKVTPAEQVRGDDRFRDAAIYYAPSATALTVTLNENLLKRAIDRQLAAAKAEPKTSDKTAAGNKVVEKKVPSSQLPAKPVVKLLGDNLAVHVEAKVVKIISKVLGEEYQAAMQRLAWNNLPILNEWHRLYPQIDPVDLHERVWHTRLVCPGGGSYVWNEKFQTMESTVYGHPGEPKKEGPTAPPQLGPLVNADFGLTFEHQGLRARAVLNRTKAEPKKVEK